MHLIRKKKRFSLLFLDEGEGYTKDCFGTRITRDSNEEVQEKGKIHICTRSFIFEPVEERKPLTKYSYRDMEKCPEISDKNGNLAEGNRRLFFSIRKEVELPDTRNPGPYQIKLFDLPQTVYFEFSFVDILTIGNQVKNIYTSSVSSLKLDLNKELEIEASQNEEDAKFDTSRLESLSEKLLTKNIKVLRIHPFMQIKGNLCMTEARIYFQPINQVSTSPVKSVKYTDITKLYKRRWRLRNLGFELSTSTNKSLFLAFFTEKERDFVFEKLCRFISPECETEESVEKMTIKWQLKQISNFEYLLYLNSAAYRTFSDFTQYPVFPWVIACYESSSLDLNCPETFRDLTKPVGALNPSRLSVFRQRYSDMQEPKFLYGTHYSTPAYVIGYLFRKYPLPMLRFHSGRFDAPDRLFDDISQDWKCVNESLTDVKELIPEFYGSDPSFLSNELHLDLGVKMNGQKVWDVRLPPWAADASDFLFKMRAALESDYVSENLHNWIDLIFGYKQSGSEAVESDNCINYLVFHPFTYEGNVDIESIHDLVQKQAIEIQISEFGQTPKQLFKIPHPPRFVQELQVPRNLVRQSSLWSVESINRKIQAKVTDIPLHKKWVSSIHLLDDKVVTTGHDGCMKIVDIDKLQKRSFTVSNLAISSSCIMNEKNIILGCYDNNLYIFNIGIGKASQTIKAHVDAVSATNYLPELGLISSVSWDFQLKLWDIRKESPLVQWFEDHEDQILCMCSHEYMITTCDKSGRVVLRDIREGVVSRFELGEKLKWVNKSKHSNHMIIALSKSLGLYESSGRIVKSLAVEGVSCFVSDGVFVVNGQEDGTLNIWEFMKGESVHNWNQVKNVTALYTDGAAYTFFAGNKEGNLIIIP